VTAAAGINFTHEAGATGSKWYPETIGAGAGFFDYDGDGWQDVLLVNGTSWTESHGVASRPEVSTMRLYRNRGNGSFEDVTQPAGLAIPLYGMGMVAADYDNDGDNDLLVTGYLHNLFFINNSNGTFTEATRHVGLQDGQWGSGAAFVDYDRDGALDLVISNYIAWTPALEQGLDCTYGTPARDYCPVRYFKGQGLTLYRNRRDGTFEDVTQRAGVASDGARAFAPYILDFNEDDWPDILVASDGTPSLLFRNQGDGTFAEVGMRAGLVLDEGGAAYAGMGIDAAYPKNDGQLCIAIGNFVGEPTTLHCRVPQESSYHPELYAEVSAWAGIGRPTLQSVTFGLFFADLDLDGFEDLFMVNGHVVDETRLRHAPRTQRPQLFRNMGTGKFAESIPPAGSGLAQELVGRGAAYADYDGDGDLDILVSQNQGQALLLRNDTPRQTHYLRVHLQGTTSNRSGLGAEVRVYQDAQVLRQMVRTGRSYYSQNELTLTFGLGQTLRAERVEITWPSGIVDVYHDIPGNTTLYAIEGSQLAPTQASNAGEHPATTLSNATSVFLQHTRAGIDAYHTQRYAEAAQAFEAARALQPDDPLPYRYLADLYWRQGRPAQAEATVRALAAVMPDAYFLDRQGSAYEESALHGLAMLLYREAVRVDTHLPGAHYNLGRLLLKQGESIRGMAEVQEALRLYPDFAEAHEVLGLAYTEQGQLDQAVTHLQQALTLHPDLATAQNHLGRIYQAQGRFDDAVRTFRDLVTRHPDLAEARHNLAVAYARKGLHTEAVEQFSTAIRLQPALYEARLDLATLLLELQRPHEAIAALHSLLTVLAGDSGASSRVSLGEARYRLGIAYLMAGQREEGVRELDMVLTEQPAHANAHVQLASVYYRTGQFTRAWRHARQAESLGAPVAALIAALRRVSAEPQP
jgi:tetratricopeptide (TPR) repeat protein